MRARGWDYVRARWYDPFLGRFISEDPIGLAGGINNYAYALNDPVNLTDPTGLCVGERYNPATTVCLLDGISSVAQPWFSSMIDEPFSLLGNAGRDFAAGAGSYFEGLGRFGRHFARQVGILGECEQQRTYKRIACSWRQRTGHATRSWPRR